MEMLERQIKENHFLGQATNNTTCERLSHGRRLPQALGPGAGNKNPRQEPV